MKKLTEKEIQKRAAEVFKDHPKAAKVFICDDGNAFVDGNHADALTHARRANVELHEVSNPAIKQEPATDQDNDAMALAKKAAELEAKEQRLKAFDSDLVKLVHELDQKQKALEAREKALAEKEAKAAAADSK